MNPVLYCTEGENDDLIIRSKKDFKDAYENLLLYIKKYIFHL